MQCFDGIGGDGSCSCQEAFTGVACHICVDPSKHGENCDEGNDVIVRDMYSICRQGVIQELIMWPRGNIAEVLHRGEVETVPSCCYLPEQGRVFVCICRVQLCPRGV